LIEHHDALRLRFLKTEGEWRQEYAPADAPLPLVSLEFGPVPDAELAAAIGQAVARLQSSLSPSQGPILRVAYLDLGISRGARVAFIVHHLAVDGVSWRILLEDFERVYKLLDRGQSVALDMKTTSYRRWTDRIIEYSKSATAEAEREYWNSVPSGATARVPL